MSIRAIWNKNPQRAMTYEPIGSSPILARERLEQPRGPTLFVAPLERLMCGLVSAAPMQPRGDSGAGSEGLVACRCRAARRRRLMVTAACEAAAELGARPGV